MGRITKNPVIIAIAFFTAIYWIVAYFLEPHDAIALLDGVVIAMSFSVFMAYSPRFFKALREKNLTGSDFVIAGISLGWLVQSTERTWRLVSRVLDDGGWMIEHHLIGYFLVLIAIAASLHLAVKDAVQGKAIGAGVSPRAWSSIVVATVVGLSIGIFAIIVGKYI